MDKFKDKVECIEDVLMLDSDVIAFTKGKNIKQIWIPTISTL